jgi:hypothetical protein
MREVTEKVMSVTKSATEILSRQKPATKKEKELILDSLEYLKQEIAQNMPFVQKSFNEQMDKTVTEARGEIESYVNGVVQGLGISRLEDLGEIDSKLKELKELKSELKGIKELQAGNKPDSADKK